jgi:hypothetical protein
LWSWEGTELLPETYTPGKVRLVVKEFEEFPMDGPIVTGADGERKISESNGSRLDYADIVEL